LTKAQFALKTPTTKLIVW